LRFVIVLLCTTNYYLGVGKNVKTSIEKCFRNRVRTTIGMVIIPRIMDSNLNKIYPPIYVQAVVQFVGSYIVAFLVFLSLDYIKTKKQK